MTDIQQKKFQFSRAKRNSENTSLDEYSTTVRVFLNSFEQTTNFILFHASVEKIE